MRIQPRLVRRAAVALLAATALAGCRRSALAGRWAGEVEGGYLWDLRMEEADGRVSGTATLSMPREPTYPERALQVSGTRAANEVSLVLTETRGDRATFELRGTLTSARSLAVTAWPRTEPEVRRTGTLEKLR